MLLHNCEDLFQFYLYILCIYLFLQYIVLSVVSFFKFAEARRSQMLDQMSREKRQQYTQQTTEWKRRILEKQNETSRKSHEDGLKHLQVSWCYKSQVLETIVSDMYLTCVDQRTLDKSKMSGYLSSKITKPKTNQKTKPKPNPEKKKLSLRFWLSVYSGVQKISLAHFSALPVVI